MPTDTSDPQPGGPDRRGEHDKALGPVMATMLKDDRELFKQFSDNEAFRKWLAGTVFGLTYEERPST